MGNGRQTTSLPENSGL